MPNDEKKLYRRIFKVSTIVVTLVVIYLTALAMVDLVQSEEPVTFLSFFRALGYLFTLSIFYVVWWTMPKKTDANQGDKPLGDDKEKEDTVE